MENVEHNKPVVAVITLPQSVITDYENKYKAAMEDITKFANEQGYTTRDDGVLVHPELGPTGFVAPRPDVVGSILAPVDGNMINVNGTTEQLYIFAQDPKTGLIKAMDKFSEYMEFVSLKLPGLDLMAYLINKARREDGSVPEFYMLVRVEGDGSGRPVLFFTSEPEEQVKKVFVDELGGELEIPSERKTVQEFGDEIIEHNKKLMPDSTTIVRDEVDVQVRRKQ